jgi:hypothetical protein
MAELENPYFVDSQFQSDNRFRQWLANMRKGSAKPENQIITRGKPENRNRTQGNRQPIEKINRAFFFDETTTQAVDSQLLSSSTY